MASVSVKLRQSEQKNKDLRIIIANLKTKAELAELEYMEAWRSKGAEVKQKDKVIHTLQKVIGQLTLENAALKSERDELRASAEQFQDRNNKLSAMVKKNSSTSDKPPSSDIFRKPKSTRERSGKKPGGQPGHQGHGLALSPNPTVVMDKRPPGNCTCGGVIRVNNKYIPKQLLDVKIEVAVVEERAYTGACQSCGKVHSGEFSKDFINPVQYGPGLLTLVAMLNSYANVSVGKTAEFLSGLTNGKINISHGTVVNINSRLAGMLEETVGAIRERILASAVAGADETGLRIDGGLEWMQVISTDMYTLYGRNEKRGGLCIEGSELLMAFTGILVHDHFLRYYKYEHLTHAECNAHILRYLERVADILKHEWAKDMAALLREANRLKKKYIKDGRDAFEPEMVQGFIKRYRDILDAGDKQYMAATEGRKNISYYNDERCLLKRLREFAEQHLLFIENFIVPFDNNGSERGVHFSKKKQKVSGCFRSKQGADSYARIATVIATLRKQNMDVHHNIEKIFMGGKIEFVEIDSA